MANPILETVRQTVRDWWQQLDTPPEGGEPEVRIRGLADYAGSHYEEQVVMSFAFILPLAIEQDAAGHRISHTDTWARLSLLHQLLRANPKLETQQWTAEDKAGSFTVQYSVTAPAGSAQANPPPD